MINENYMLAVALRFPAYLKDVVEADALPEHQSELSDLLKIYNVTGDIPSKGNIERLYGFTSEEFSEWDIQKAYNMLIECNTQRYFSEAALAFSVSDNKDEDFEKIKNKYKRCYQTGDEHQITISCHNDFLTVLKKVSENKDHYLKTGIKSLANTLSSDDIHAWRQKTLTSIIGMSGTGKTIVLVNLARDSLEMGYSVLYITTEMDEFDILERLAKSLYQVEDERDVILKQPPSIGKLTVTKVHPYDTTYIDIQGIIDSLGWKPDIIYIDYADELKAHEKTTSEYDAQGIIYAGLKKLAEINDVPVVTATQTNRKAEGEDGGTKKYVGYAEVADSSKKIRLADALFSIVQTANDKQLGIISLAVIKNRKNASGQKMKFDINYKKMRINPRESVILNEKDVEMDMPTRRI
jgi:replicative DNA helicase